MRMEWSPPVDNFVILASPISQKQYIHYLYGQEKSDFI